METKTKTLTTVEITKAELTEWVNAHMDQLKPEDAIVRPNAQTAKNPGSPLEITWGISRPFMKTVLKAMIPALPDQFNVQMVQNSDTIAAKVSWQDGGADVPAGRMAPAPRMTRKAKA